MGDPAFFTYCLPLGASSFQIWCDTEGETRAIAETLYSENGIYFSVDSWYESWKTQGSLQDEKV